MSVVETERAIREAVFHAIAAPALILGPDRRVRAANFAAQRACAEAAWVQRATLSEWLHTAGFQCGPALDEAVGRAFEGSTKAVTLASLNGRAATLSLCPVIVSQRVVGACATLNFTGAPPAHSPTDAPLATGQVHFVWTPANDALTLSGSVRATFGASFEGPAQTLQGFLIRAASDEATSLQRELRVALTTGSIAPSEFRVRHDDGGQRVILCVGASSVSAPGEPARVCGFFSDVTSLATQRQREVETRKHEALARLAGGVVHDFNLLTAQVSACAQTLREVVDEQGPGRAEVMDLALAARRATDLVRQMTLFARKQRVTRSIHTVQAVFDRVMPVLRRVVPSSLKLEVEVDAATPTVAIDARQFEQSIVNLAVNAREATRGVGTLTLKARPVREIDRDGSERVWAEITVHDDGPGIAPDVRERLFEPYFSTRSVGRGHGLASVHSIVRALAGEVNVVSEPGRGTTFVLRIPSSQQADPIGGRRRSLTPKALSPDGLDALSVMVLDRDDTLRRAVLSSLRSAGVRAIEADGVEQALARCPPRLDVLLTEVIPADAPGASFEALRAQQPEARVIYMIGAAGAPSDLGPLATTLARPFTTSELIEALTVAATR